MECAAIALASGIQPGKNSENPGRQDDHRAARRLQPILNEETQRDRNASFHAVANPEWIERRGGWRNCFAGGLKGICRKRVEQPIEFAKLLGNLVDGQRVSGELKHLLDGNGGGISVWRRAWSFSRHCARARVHLRERGGAARGVRVGIGKNTQTIGGRGMCRFELRAKMSAEDGLLWQRLNKRLDRSGDPVEAGDDFRERGKSRAKIFALHRSEVQQVLQSRDGRREAPVVQVGGFG